MKRRLHGAFGGLSAAFMLSACQTTTPDLVPAVLSQTSPEVTAVLSAAASDALGGVKVTLAPDVLTTDSTLILETQLPRTLDSNRNTGLLNDRARPAPDVLKLMKSGSSCYLLHEKSGQTMPLSGVSCQAL